MTGLVFGIGWMELLCLAVLGLGLVGAAVAIGVAVIAASRRKSLPCPHCGGPATPGTAFCAHCGKSLTPV